MNTAIILPGDGILLTAVTTSPLPTFFTAETRPDYVPDWIVAIFPAYLSTDRGHYHLCVVRFGCALGRDFAAIAEAHKTAEKEAHELSSLDEVPDYTAAL